MEKSQSDDNKQYRAEPIRMQRRASDVSDLHSDISCAHYDDPPPTLIEFDNQSSSGGSTQPQSDEFVPPLKRKGPRKRILKATFKQTSEKVTKHVRFTTDEECKTR